MKGDPNQIKKKWLGNPDQIKKKWLPIIDNHFNLKNKRIEELICFYCEWLAITEEPELANKLIDIKDKIDSFERIGIKRKVFNPSSGVIEYELVNGKFVPEKGGTFELNNDELIKIFGIEFIRTIDPEGFRDNQLNKLI